MNIECWIGSVINLPSVPCFGVCGNILTVSHNTPICTIFFTNCSTSVIYVIFTFAVYDTSLSSLCCTFSCFGPPYRRDCCNCFTILHCSYELMNFWPCKLVNLSNQKSSSYWRWQQVGTFISICHEGPKMLLLFKLPKIWWVDSQENR